ncbi:Ig-like domain-containing protein [Blastopirellula marina]|nr:Ig-like domain-containing protein [Blastopirellula marina]
MPMLTRVMLFAILTISLGAGCLGRDASHPDLAEVTGVVTVNGKPVQNVAVVFNPEAGGHASRGTTDAEGKFQLKYSGSAAGATLGRHDVLFIYNDADGPANVLPRKYADQTASMNAEVTQEGPNEFTFDLKGR